MKFEVVHVPYFYKVVLLNGEFFCCSYCSPSILDFVYDFANFISVSLSDIRCVKRLLKTPSVYSEVPFGYVSGS